MKTRKIKNNEAKANIVKLPNKKAIDEFFGNMDKYDGYIISRFSEAISKGFETCEIAQIRYEGSTSVSYIEKDEMLPIARDRFNKAMERKDFDKAARWKVLIDNMGADDE